MAAAGQILTERAANSVSVTKVVAHATAKDVAMGRTTAFNKWGNDNADALAVSGALLHPELADRRKRMQGIVAITSVQRMMVDILARREEQRRNLKARSRSVVDIGSEDNIMEVSSNDASNDLDESEDVVVAASSDEGEDAIEVSSDDAWSEMAPD